MLERDQLKRYARHLILPEVGLAGQQRLADSSVLIVGLGGLGSPIAQYLAATGIGRIGLSEFDTVEIHNLQRQTLYTTSDIGKPKLEVAKARLVAVNPTIQISTHSSITDDNATQMLAGFDLILDATDNFASRYLISDTCTALQKPLVWGAAVRWEGMVSVFDQQHSLRNFFPVAPETTENCDTLGVHGPLLGMIGSMMASQAIKYLLGLETLVGYLWLYDALDNQARKIKMQSR